MFPYGVTRDTLMTVIGRYLFYTHIEPMTRVLAGRPYEGKAPKGEKLEKGGK